MYRAIIVPCLVFSDINDHSLVILPVTILMYSLCIKSHSSKLKYGNLIHLLFMLQPRKNFIVFPTPFITTLARRECERSNDQNEEKNTFSPPGSLVSSAPHLSLPRTRPCELLLKSPIRSFCPKAVKATS